MIILGDKSKKLDTRIKESLSGSSVAFPGFHNQLEALKLTASDLTDNNDLLLSDEEQPEDKDKD